MKILGFIRKYIAFIAIGATFAWAVTAVTLNRTQEAPANAIVLRIGHWQLEASVREALDEMASDYRKLNPNVYIIQDAIPEMIYNQWLTTQLMGGTAPDLIEVGLGTLPYHLWVQYYNRYFTAITRNVNRPNPHNAGTELADTPLRSTFKDGMRNNYIEEMQEYVSVPLSQFGTRVFYNRDLLKKLTGLDTAPENYRDFLAVCRTIKQHRDPRGQPYVPIAGSKYHFPWWDWPMFKPVTYSVARVADFNRDGFVANDELFVAFKTGRMTFTHPAVKASFQMIREITDQFQAGWTGLTRDEAVFLFAQQRAVFMTTGTWDARSLQEQARGVFEVGVMDYPMPTKDDPVYGPVIEGPCYERLGGGFPFGVTRTSKHPEIAMDFLLFMAGRKQNEKLNRIIGWIPSIVGAEVDTSLQAFEPHLEGVYGNFPIDGLGGETWREWVRLFSLFQIGQLSYEELTARFEPHYKQQGLKDFREQQKDWRRSMHNNERFLSGIRALALSATGEAARSYWVKYRSLSASRQIWPEITHARQMKLVDGEIELPGHGPYEYGENVIAKVKARLQKDHPPQPANGR